MMETLDQAETLRKLMHSRQEHSDEVVVPLSIRMPGTKLKVFTFAGGADPQGKKDLVFQMNEVFKNDGFRTLLLNQSVETTSNDIEAIKKENSDLDFILVNLKTGIQASILDMHHPLYRTVVVLTPETSSMTDAFGLVKLLHQRRGVRRFHVIVNQVTGSDVALKLFNKFYGVVNRFLDVEMSYMGHGKFSENIRHSVLNKKYLLDLKEDTFVSLSADAEG